MERNNRLKQIIDICELNSEVYVNDLAKSLEVSKATIRRDLQYLEEQKIVERFHGGAKINIENTLEPSMLLKSNKNVREKVFVAKLAASFIKDNQIIYIDAGSSTFEMIPYIKAKNIMIFTIGIPHIVELISEGRSVNILGGTVLSNTQAITGSTVLNQLDDIHFDLAFLGVNCIHQQFGLTTSNEQEASVKAKVISKSTTSYVLSNLNKFDLLNPFKFANFNDVIFLSDDISDKYKTKTKYYLINGENNIEN